LDSELLELQPSISRIINILEFKIKLFNYEFIIYCYNYSYHK